MDNILLSKEKFFFKVDKIFLTSSGFWLKIMVILPARIVTRGNRSFDWNTNCGKNLPKDVFVSNLGAKTQRLCAFFGCGAVQCKEVKLSKFMQKLYKHQEFLTWLLSANYERNVIANNLMRNLPRISHGFLVSKVR